MAKNQGTPGEFDLIARYFAPLAEAEDGAFGLTDDTAVLKGPSAQNDLVVTTDTMVEGVHFPAETRPEDVAAKLLAVNLSDIASMGAVPRHYTLAAALPDPVDEDWIARFAKSLAKEQQRFDVVLAGGDTVSTPGPLTLTLTTLGTVETGRALRRAGAQAGDAIWLSGTLGDAAFGLLARRNSLGNVTPEDRNALVARLDRPTPRLNLGRRLRSTGLAHAAIDVSDGVVADLGHLCEASGTGAVIDAGNLPLSDAATRILEDQPGLLDTVLAGGDDYELLFATAPDADSAIRALSEDLALPLTRIGRMHDDQADGTPRVRVLKDDGTDVTPAGGGWRHF